MFFHLPLKAKSILRIVTLLDCWLLNNFVDSQNLPRSLVRVDEDFWYMHGENGCIDSSIQGGGWPKTSIFDNRSPVALLLNPTLSQSVCELDVNDSVAIENLKAMLFRAIHESREEFFNLRRSDESFVVAIRVVIVAMHSAITTTTCCTFLKKVIVIIKTLAPCVSLR